MDTEENKNKFIYKKERLRSNHPNNSGLTVP